MSDLNDISDVQEAQDELPMDIPAETPTAPAQGDIEAAPALLSLKDISANIDVAYSKLRSYIEVEGVLDFLGAVDAPGVKGVRYPPEAQELLRSLMDAAARKLVTPGTAAAWLKNARTSSISANDGEGGAIEAFPKSGNGSALAVSPAALVRSLEAMQTVAYGVQRASDNIEAAARSMAMNAPRPDRLLTLKEAAAITGLSARTIRAHIPHVTDGTRHKWRESALQVYLQRMEEAL